MKVACDRDCPNFKEIVKDFFGLKKYSTNIIQSWHKDKGWVTWDCGIPECKERRDK